MIRRLAIATVTATALALLLSGPAGAGQATAPAARSGIGQTTPPVIAPSAPPSRPWGGTGAAVRTSPLPTTQALFESYVQADKMPGIVGAFGVGDLPTVFVGAGHVSDDPGAAVAGPDSLWRVYSMTKPITAMAAMILIDDGRIRLDEPVSDFIPAFAHMRVQLRPDTLESRPAARPITIRNLLTHTAGLGYTIVSTGPLRDAYTAAGIEPMALNAQVERGMRARRPATLAEFADRVAAQPLIADPGTRWSYSVAMDVLARVVEVAGRMPFDRFVQTRIFDPLDMRSSYWTVPSSEVGRLATNYLFAGDQRVALDPGATSVFLNPPSFPYGGAGLVMSARDYDRFLHMLQDMGTLDGHRILKAETAALAMSNLLPAGVHYTGLQGAGATPGQADQIGFGAGGSVYLVDVPGGAMRGTYGWGGAAGTIGWVDPARHTRGTIMVNYMPPERWPVRSETIRALLTDAQRYRH